MFRQQQLHACSDFLPGLTFILCSLASALLTQIADIAGFNFETPIWRFASVSVCSSALLTPCIYFVGGFERVNNTEAITRQNKGTSYYSVSMSVMWFACRKS